jgi:uncharacterized membrane protein YfcA
LTISVFVLLAIGAILASTVSGIAGIGGGMIYLPFLTEGVGLKKAVPYLTFLLLAGNFSRAYFSRDGIDWKVIRHFWIGAVPGTLVGALFYTALSPFWISKALGVYLVAYVVLSFTKAQWPKTATLNSIAVMGGPAGFTSAVVGGSGPIMAPYLLRYGLVKNGFLGTEAIGAASMHVIKIAVWGGASLITLNDVILLLPLAALMIAGSYAGKLLVTRMHAATFRRVLLFVLAIVGFRFLFF